MMKEMPKTIALLSTVAALALAAAAATAQTQTQTDGQSQDDQSATEQYLLDEPAPEPADNAAEVPSATEDADSGSMPATGAEAETAQAPEAAQTDSASNRRPMRRRPSMRRRPGITSRMSRMWPFPSKVRSASSTNISSSAACRSIPRSVRPATG